MTAGRKTGGASRPVAFDLEVGQTSESAITVHPVAFDLEAGRANRLAIARALAPEIGLELRTIALRLRMLDDDREAVIRHYQTHGARAHRPRAIVHNGRAYRSREAMAKELAGTVGNGHSRHAVRAKLRELADDVAAVIAWCRQTPARPDHNRIAITAEGKPYVSYIDYGRELSRRYGVTAEVIQGWISKNGPETALAQAKAFAAKKRRHRKEHPQDNTVVVFGWRWRSFSAMKNYYNLANRPHIKSDWEDHTLRDGKPGCLFPDLARKLTRLWEVGDLNEWNRFGAAAEAKMPAHWLPINQEPEPVNDPRERIWIDALMPQETVTPRRAALREIEEARRFMAERHTRKETPLFR